MKLKILNYLPLMFCGALASTLCMSSLPAGAAVYVRVAPPAVKVETRPASPGRGYVWTGGYYRWNGNRYVWTTGRWVNPPRSGAVWVPGHWVHGNKGWYWVDGHWR